MDQLSLFGDMAPLDPKRIEEKVAHWERTGAVKSTFSAAEKRDIEFMVGLFSWIMTANTMNKGRLGLGERFNDLEPRHHGDIVLERFVVALKLLNELKEARANLEGHADAERQYAALLKKMTEERFVLTNREMCLMLCDLSLEGPLDTAATAEYMRAFAMSYGMDKYIEAHGLHEAPLLDYERCKMVRLYNSASRRFPHLDKGEIDAFNAALRKRQRDGIVWKVAEPEMAERTVR